MSEQKTKKRRSVFSKLSNLVFEPSTKKETIHEAESDDVVVNNTVEEEKTTPAQNFNIPTTGDGVFDKNFSDALEQVIEENNIDGVDYLEFKQALKGMAGVSGLNESTSFQSVFNTLKVGYPSLSKSSLLSAIDFYISVLKKEEEAFNSEMQANLEQEVISRREEAESLNQENSELVKKIQEVNEKISENQQKAIKLNSEASESESRINQTNKNFIATLSHLISNLEIDKDKIEQLIQE